MESDLLNGKWRLVYTTSASILGSDRPEPLRPKGPTYQIIDTAGLRAQNQEGPPLYNEVKANLRVTGPDSVDVQFSFFKIGGAIPIKAPADAAGFLKMTYLDSEMRISRGDKGNVFVLLQEDPGRRVIPGPFL